MSDSFRRVYDFTKPLDDLWDAVAGDGWSFDLGPDGARLSNTTEGKADVYLRPCAIYGDSIEFLFARGAARKGLFEFCFSGSMEYITMELDLATGHIKVITHEHHKPTPRFEGKVDADFAALTVVRERDALPSLPYEGSAVKILLDGKTAAEVRRIDFLPECKLMFSLIGPGELTLRKVSLSGPPRPRPEYVRVGTWQQKIRPTTPANVDALIEGVRQAAAANVEILVTPETSLTGLRPTHPDLDDRGAIRAALERFGRAVAETPDAPYTLIGYPEWIDGAAVDGATLDEVKINCHRFVRPDGTLGPIMAKVHSCEIGLWHGRRYNLQRVAGVEVAVGVCHDGSYPDVWTTGVMGGARLCLHPMSCGGPSGRIPDIVKAAGGRAKASGAFWASTNANGGAAIVHPEKTRNMPDNILAVAADLTRANPTYPDYSPMGDLLASATLRLWDANGGIPLRTLRSGRKGYELWSQLIPELQEV